MRLEYPSDVHIVMQKYAPMVYRIAYNRTYNHSDAEDVSQDVFLKLIDKNPDFDSEEDRKAWLIRVTVNHSISLWRASRRHRASLNAEPPPSMSLQSDNENLFHALKKLSSQERLVIDLYYYEGYKTVEIAEVLGCRHNTVRSRLSRARKKLKEELIRLEGVRQ